ncbi:centromere protein T isoform X2 [Gymnodraco acuticeps]|uniref:Centromere protein T isoform X2 n=1 Tax=Gymnodraco acuticeps TaxID=8218 RepID=A0A6P8U1J4_GYMAC|nr:centromere protein T isoform X2 [Gymnodraco acuticeps]
MDPIEDLSARVLLTQILSTETPRTPFTRSASQQLSASATRRSSSRLRNKDAVPQTPKAILKHSQIHKLRKSISMQSLNATRRVGRSVSFRLSNIPPVNSMLLEDGETPRHLLKNILQTEPVSTPMVHGRASSDGRQSSSADSSKGCSIELSGLDLPDLTIGAASTQKRLNRKRHLIFDLSAFEKRLDAGPDLKENKETEQSSLTLSSPTLKTPFVEVRTERTGLRRRALPRRRISVAGFDAAVDRWSMEGETSRWSLSKTTSSEGFTLGLSTLCDSNITSDIIHCDKALCAQPGAMTDNLSIAATRDKPTVRVEEDQMEVEEDQMEVEEDQMEVEVEEDQMEVEEDQMEVEQDQVEVELGKEKSVNAFPTEGGAEPQNGSLTASISQREEEKHTGDDQMKDNVTVAEEEAGVAESLDTVMEEEENNVEAPTEEEGEADSQNEENAAVRSPSEEEEAAAESQTEEEQDGVDSQVEEDVVPDTQTEEEEVAGHSQTEEQDGVDCEPEEVAEAVSQSEEEEVAPDSQEAAVDIEPEEDAAKSQSEEEDVAPDSQEAAVDIEPEEDAAKSRSEEEEETADDQSEQEVPAEEVEDDLADSQPEDKHDGKLSEDDAEQSSEQEEQDLEHTSRRAPRSEGPLVVPVTEAAGDLDHATEEGWSDGKSKAPSSLHMGSPETHASYTDADPGAVKENSFHLPELANETKDRLLNDNSPEEAAEEEEDEEEEEEEEEEDSDAIPSKTPAFVRQKMSFFQPKPQNIQASRTGEAIPVPKPKPVRKKGKGPAKKQTDLPKSYLMNVFKHFAKTKVSPDVYPVLKDIMNKYFDRLAEDLETYALHAKRKTIEIEDAELLLRRQGHVTDMVPVEVLIEKYLRMEQRKLLIPIATSGNIVIPKKR